MWLVENNAYAGAKHRLYSKWKCSDSMEPFFHTSLTKLIDVYTLLDTHTFAPLEEGNWNILFAVIIVVHMKIEKKDLINISKWR